jgi:hypothetical protein
MSASARLPAVHWALRVAVCGNPPELTKIER